MVNSAGVELRRDSTADATHSHCFLVMNPSATSICNPSAFTLIHFPFHPFFVRSLSCILNTVGSASWLHPANRRRTVFCDGERAPERRRRRRLQQPTTQSAVVRERESFSFHFPSCTRSPLSRARCVCRWWSSTNQTANYIWWWWPTAESEGCWALLKEWMMIEVTVAWRRKLKGKGGG